MTTTANGATANLARCQVLLRELFQFDWIVASEPERWLYVLFWPEA